MDLMNTNTISSREIAEMTGKRHDNVIRDIRNIEANLANSNLRALWVLGTYEDNQGKIRSDYKLTKKGSLLLGTKYNDQTRLILIERWEELERNPKVALPSTKDLALMVIKAEEEKERLLEVNTIQEETIKIQAPKVNYFDNVLQSTSSYTTNQIAKEFGLSARSLNAKLQEIGVQYKQNGTWLLYAKHQNKGYTKTKTHTYVDALGNPGTQMQTVWTEKGRKFIHELMNEGKLELAS